RSARVRIHSWVPPFVRSCGPRSVAMRKRNEIVLWKSGPAGPALRRRAQGAIRFTRTRGVRYRWRLEGHGVVPAVLSAVILIPASLLALALGLILLALLLLV